MISNQCGLSRPLNFGYAPRTYKGSIGSQTDPLAFFLIYTLYPVYLLLCEKAISWSLLKILSIELVMLSNHLILCHPLLLLPSVFPSIRVFSNELAVCIRWPKYWNFSFSISPSNEYSKLISIRIDRFDLLAVQGTYKSLLQHHDSKHQFFSAQPSSWSSSHICI